jgi:hypothetical protein
MENGNLYMVMFSLVGGYLLLKGILSIIQNEISYSIQEQLLQNTLSQYKHSPVAENLCKPLPTDRVIHQDLDPGCVYSKTNRELWDKVDEHDFSKPKGCTFEEQRKELLRTIRNTECHGDKLMDTTRNGLINEYYNKTMLDVDMSKVDPYDNEMYASVEKMVEMNTMGVKKDIQKSNPPFPTEQTHVTKNSNPNPVPIHHPVLSDTHYKHATIRGKNHIPSVIRCDTIPSIDKPISTNLISDHLLDQRVSGFKVTQTNSISADMINTADISYAPKDLASRYNPNDNNLYKVSSRTPVRTLDNIARKKPCGNDYLESVYAEIEHNDLVQTTTA